MERAAVVPQASEGWRGYTGVSPVGNDSMNHRAMRPVFCARCGHTYADGLIVEYWVSYASVFHCWCAFCKQSVDVADANLIIGLEVEH
jgi:hypothetical protein